MLTWAVVPIMQGYAISGAFTVLGRVRSSLKRLWVFYLIIGALAAAVRWRRGSRGMGGLGMARLANRIGALNQTKGCSRYAGHACRCPRCGWVQS